MKTIKTSNTTNIKELQNLLKEKTSSFKKEALNFKEYSELNETDKFNYTEILKQLEKINNEKDLTDYREKTYRDIKTLIDHGLINYRLTDIFINLAHIKKAILRVEDIKKELNKKPVENEDGYKVGDILEQTFGYDQTNTYFYQVISTTRKSIKVTRICGKYISELSDQYEDVLAPSKNSFTGSEIVTTRSKHPKEGYFGLYKVKEGEVFRTTNSYYGH